MDPWGTCGRRRELTPAGCPLTSTHTLWHVGTHTHTLNKCKQNLRAQLGVVAHACHPSTWEVETGGLRVQGHPLATYRGQPGLPETLALKTETTIET